MIVVSEFQYCEIVLDTVLRYYAEHALLEAGGEWDTAFVDLYQRRVIFRRIKPPVAETVTVSSTTSKVP